MYLKGLYILGIHAELRVDPERDKLIYTVILDGIRLGDTDNPAKLLDDWYKKNFDHFHLAQAFSAIFKGESDDKIEMIFKGAIAAKEGKDEQ